MMKGEHNRLDELPKDDTGLNARSSDLNLPSLEILSEGEMFLYLLRTGASTRWLLHRQFCLQESSFREVVIPEHVRQESIACYHAENRVRNDLFEQQVSSSIGLHGT